MSPIAPEIRTALQNAHRKLVDDLSKLRQLAGSQCQETLHDRLCQARQDLAEHFRLEEKCGYLESVRMRDPGLEESLNRLTHEHQSLLAQVDELLTRIPASSGKLSEVCQEVLTWVRHVQEHEVRENDLIQDAYTNDFGAGE